MIPHYQPAAAHRFNRATAQRKKTVRESHEKQLIPDDGEDTGEAEAELERLLSGSSPKVDADTSPRIPPSSPPTLPPPAASEFTGVESFIHVAPPLAPFKHKPESEYERVSGDLSSSFHSIYKFEKKKHKDRPHPTLYFFKQNKGATPIDDFMYELEATSCAFYHLIAPHHTPTARALFNSSVQYIGVLSKNLAGFKSTLEEPLKEEDLIIDVLAQKQCTIEDLEALDNRALEENLNLDGLPDNQIIKELVIKGKDSLIRRVPIKARDLRNYRTIKGLAIGLTTSYVFEDDDCHTGNISKDGKRIDFDMSPWPITYIFKKTGPIDWTFRDPANRFVVTARDIETLPNFRDAQPFYWPTEPVRVLPEAVMSVAATMFNISRNAFQSKDNAIYKKLEKNPVFIYHKFATLMKYALTNETMYRRISELHIRDESRFKPTPTSKSVPIIDMMAKHQLHRVNYFRQELSKLPSFQTYLKENGDKILKTILLDFAEYNAKIERKFSKHDLYRDQIIDLTQVIKDYCSLCAKSQLVKNPDI